MKLGDEVELYEKVGRKETTITGRLVGVRLAEGIMLTGSGEFRGVQFQIQDSTGSKKWSRTIADQAGAFTSVLPEKT